MRPKLSMDTGFSPATGLISISHTIRKILNLIIKIRINEAIHVDHDNLHTDEDTILSFHRMMPDQSKPHVSGKYKTTDNFILETVPKCKGTYYI